MSEVEPSSPSATSSNSNSSQVSSESCGGSPQKHVLRRRSNLTFVQRTLMSLGFSKVKASLLVVGLANSGKTSIVNAIRASKEESEVVPTVGFSVEKFTLLKTKLTVMDMSGQARYKKLWECYYDDVQGAIFVVDAADAASLADSSAVLAEMVGHDDLQGTPLLVFANKSDLKTALPPAEIAERMQLAGIADRPWQITASSAVTGDGVQEGIKWLLDEVKALQLRRRRGSPTFSFSRSFRNRRSPLATESTPRASSRLSAEFTRKEDPGGLGSLPNLAPHGDGGAPHKEARRTS